MVVSPSRCEAPTQADWEADCARIGGGRLRNADAAQIGNELRPAARARRTVEEDRAVLEHSVLIDDAGGVGEDDAVRRPDRAESNAAGPDGLVMIVVPSVCK